MNVWLRRVAFGSLIISAGVLAYHLQAPAPSGQGSDSEQPASSHEANAPVPADAGNGRFEHPSARAGDVSGNREASDPSLSETASTNARRELHLEGFLAFERVPNDLIQSIVLEAESDNAKAQYSLGKLLKACEHMLASYPDPDALQAFTFHADKSRNPELVNGVTREARACWDLRDAYGEQEATPVEWIVASAENGYGPALAAMAGDMSQLAMVDLDTLPQQEQMAIRKSARVLALAAARTRNPHALFAISGVLAGESAIGHRPGEALAWTYAACRFGLGCGPDNFWLQWMCRWSGDCDAPYAASLPGYLEYTQYSPAQQDYAARRAPELIRALENGDWEDLNLEYPHDPSIAEALGRMTELRMAAEAELASHRQEQNSGRQ